MKYKETHACKAPNCNRQIPKRYLMCRNHWYQVPEALRVAVLHEWAEVQSTGIISIAYARAARDAIESIGRTYPMGNLPPAPTTPQGATPVQSFDEPITR